MYIHTYILYIVDIIDMWWYVSFSYDTAIYIYIHTKAYVCVHSGRNRILFLEKVPQVSWTAHWSLLLSLCRCLVVYTECHGAGICVKALTRWATRPDPYKSLRIQSPCQMVIRVYSHLRNARYLGSMKPFSEGERGSVGSRLMGTLFPWPITTLMTIVGTHFSLMLRGCNPYF